MFISSVLSVIVATQATQHSVIQSLYHDDKMNSRWKYRDNIPRATLTGTVSDPRIKF